METVLCCAAVNILVYVFIVYVSYPRDPSDDFGVDFCKSNGFGHPFGLQCHCQVRWFHGLLSDGSFFAEVNVTSTLKFGKIPDMWFLGARIKSLYEKSPPPLESNLCGWIVGILRYPISSAGGAEDSDLIIEFQFIVMIVEVYPFVLLSAVYFVFSFDFIVNSSRFVHSKETYLE